ncbi:MAG: Cna B-type domain-containing protein, partial [Oscillospiraceae bacterium]|nr:Cna B-type domain-containing protein [Oscillospiraceae bacterium]
DNGATWEDYGDPVEITADNMWKYTFRGLPDTNEDGTITYKYQVKEVPVSGFDTDYSQVVTVAQTENTKVYKQTVTNTLVDYTALKVAKVWLGQDGTTALSPLPDHVTASGITVQLMKDGQPCGDPVTIKASDNWEHVFERLPLDPDFDLATDTFPYSVVETDAFGFIVSYSSITWNEDESRYEITVTNTQTETIDLPIGKAWSDGSSRHTGDTVTVHLYADGVDTGIYKVLSAPSWEAVFEDIPKYSDADGTTEIRYTVVEDSVKDYSASVAEKIYGATSGGYTWVNVGENEAFDSQALYRIRAVKTEAGNKTNIIGLNNNNNGVDKNTNPGDENQRYLWSISPSGAIKSAAADKWLITDVDRKNGQWSNYNATVSDSEFDMTITRTSNGYYTISRNKTSQSGSTTTAYLTRDGKARNATNDDTNFYIEKRVTVPGSSGTSGYEITNTKRSNPELAVKKDWSSIDTSELDEDFELTIDVYVAKLNQTTKKYEIVDVSGTEPVVYPSNAQADPVYTLTLNADNGWYSTEMLDDMAAHKLTKRNSDGTYTRDRDMVYVIHERPVYKIPGDSSSEILYSPKYSCGTWGTGSQVTVNLNGSPTLVYVTSGEISTEYPVEVTVTNYYRKTMPETGGIGIFPYIFGGLALMASSSAMYVYSVRRKRERRRNQ